jgi:hypothetical protein
MNSAELQVAEWIGRRLQRHSLSKFVPTTQDAVLPPEMQTHQAMDADTEAAVFAGIEAREQGLLLRRANKASMELSSKLDSCAKGASVVADADAEEEGLTARIAAERRLPMQSEVQRRLGLAAATVLSWVSADQLSGF